MLKALKQHNHKPSSLSRYVIECPNCAVIYRSRQYWYGNQDPVETVVRTEIQHIWPGVRPQWNSLNEILLKPIKQSYKPRFQRFLVKLMLSRPLHLQFILASQTYVAAQNN